MRWRRLAGRAATNPFSSSTVRILAVQDNADEAHRVPLPQLLVPGLQEALNGCRSDLGDAGEGNSLELLRQLGVGLRRGSHEGRAEVPDFAPGLLRARGAQPVPERFEVDHHTSPSLIQSGIGSSFEKPKDVHDVG